MKQMFEEHTQWTEGECFYVVATHGFRRAWLAGPYRTWTEAEKVLDRAIRWVVTRSGDPDARTYTYCVARHHNGHGRSILGEIHAAIAEAKAVNSPPAETVAAVLPIVAVAVRGGLIEDMDATLPLHVVVEDWDITDDDTGEKPARNVWTLAASLPGPNVEELRRLIAND